MRNGIFFKNGGNLRVLEDDVTVLRYVLSDAILCHVIRVCIDFHVNGRCR